jgi:hypothetical protein
LSHFPIRWTNQKNSPLKKKDMSSLKLQSA